MHNFDKFFKLSSAQKRCGPPKNGEKHIYQMRSGDQDERFRLYKIQTFMPGCILMGMKRLRKAKGKENNKLRNK